MSLPKQAGPWTRPDAARRITADSIFDYMDGAGEMYLAYRFDHLDVYEYKAADASLGTILVELYWMKTSDDAFGLLSTDWGGDPVDLGGKTPIERKASLAPHSRALYGAGLLRAWSDNLYIRILASRETDASRAQVVAIARALASGRDNPAAPLITQTPPVQAAPGGDEARSRSPRAGGRRADSWALQPTSLVYFRSHLVLNSAFFLASQDVLGLGPEAEAITAQYVPPSRGQAPLRLVVVRYASPAAAEQALSTFLQAYAREKTGTRRQPTGAMKTKTGWLAWALEGRGLAIALDAPTEQGAAGVTRAAVASLGATAQRGEQAAGVKSGQ